MEGFRSYPQPSGEIDDLPDPHRQRIQARRSEKNAAQKRRWKTRRWIAFLGAVVGFALFFFGLYLAVDWPGPGDRSVESGREIVTLDDVQTDSTAAPAPRPGAR